MTSHDAVGIARRALGERRVGHAGTLDPFATGLLVLLVGRATRLLPYLEGEPKVYDATIRFGSETDTDDLTGAPIRTAAPPTDAGVRTAIGGLTGAIVQHPPQYSAKQVAGRRAYAAARRGESVELVPVTVIVHAWTIHGWRGADLDVTITCGGGTYIRALARDSGRAAGSAAHLAALRRTRSGPFDVAQAVTTEQLREGEAPLHSPLAGLGTLARQTLDEADIARVTHGNPAAATVDGERAALIDATQTLVAIAERDGSLWRPRVVLREP
jgi:tRNA pseudouridine55 synthase